MTLLFGHRSKQRIKELKNIELLTTINGDWKVQNFSNKAKRFSQEEWQFLEARSEE